MNFFGGASATSVKASARLKQVGVLVLNSSLPIVEICVSVRDARIPRSHTRTFPTAGGGQQRRYDRVPLRRLARQGQGEYCAEPRSTCFGSGSLHLGAEVSFSVPWGQDQCVVERRSSVTVSVPLMPSVPVCLLRVLVSDNSGARDGEQ